MDSATIHGLPRVFSSSRWSLRVFWAGMFLASCIVFGYVFHLRVQEFKLYQIVLRVNRKDSLKLQFPSLTICDTDLPGDPKSPNESLPKNCEVNQLNNTADHFLLNDCKQFMTKVDISCSYGGRSICRFPKNFTAAHSWKRCNTFNYKGNIVQPVPGRYGGLHLLMFKNSSMAHITDNEENPFQETTRGLQLQIHAPNTSANQVFANQIPLTPGYQVQVKLQKKVFTRLPAPFPSKCSSKTSVKQLVRGKYTTSNCKFSCFMERMYTHCGGILPKFRGIVPENEYPNTEKYKDENTLFDCISKLYTTQGFVNCDCPIACEEELFESQVTLTQWKQSSIVTRLHPQIAKQLGMREDEINLETWLKNIVLLSVFYEDFTTEYVTEHALYGISSLASDFGGLLGLCIGASVISICEIIYLSSDWFYDKLFKRATEPVNEDIGESPVTKFKQKSEVAFISG